MNDRHEDAPNATPTPSDTFEGQRHAEELVMARRLLDIALVLWPLFGLLDWMVVSWIAPGRLWVYWGLRGIGLIPLLALKLRLRLPPPPSLRALIVWDLFAYGLAAGLIGLMCLEYDGITSPYTAGVILVVSGRGATMTFHWKRALTHLGLIAAAHPVVLLSSAIWSQRIRAQFLDPRSVALLLEYLAFLLAAWIIAGVTSHMNWRLRREVFEARQRIGRYRLRRRIGFGGMGEVWEAFDTVLKRNAALKLLGARRNTPEDIARFQREVRATSELSHPNTVRVFDHGVTHDGRWYYTMELLHGCSLRQLVDAQGSLPPGRVAAIGAQTASALAEAHARGIVHRDIKPDNIFITPVSGGDHVKLLDFGIASIAENRTYANMMETRWLGGTPHFMSPEVIRGDPVVPASDLYSLGATLYHALTGNPPFSGQSVAETLAAHLSIAPNRLCQSQGAPAARELEDLVLRCLAKRPRERYESAEALARALRELAERQTGTWSSVSTAAALDPRPQPTVPLDELATTLPGSQTDD